MAPKPELPSELLRRARELEAAHDARGVVALLDALPERELTEEPELGFLLATALRRTGQRERALALCEAIAGPCVRRGRDRLWRLRLNLEAALHFDAGRLAAAEHGWSDLGASASEAGDEDLVARAHNNLGIVFTLQGRLDEALAAYGRALTAHHRLGDRLGVAQAHANLAIAYRELGFHPDADSHFRAAIAHARAAGDESVLGRAEEERALVFLLNGDVRMAEAAARRALGRFRRIEDRAGEGESLRVLGLAALAAGRAREAESHLRQALERAVSSGSALLHAETLEALASLREQASDERRGGEDMRAEAERMFTVMGAGNWGRHVRARVAALVPSREAGAPSHSR